MPTPAPLTLTQIVPAVAPPGPVPVWCVLLGALGLIVGSFLNVVIARVPEGLSVVRPPSRCPHCLAPVAPRDNVPVVSWLLLRGRARCCGAGISWRYPLVEVGTAAAFAAVTAWALPREPWTLPAYLYLAALGIALAVIDLDVYRLPYVMVAGSFPVVLALLALAAFVPHGPEGWRPLVRAVVGGCVLWCAYMALHLLYRNGMGMGDVRLSGLLGLYLAWRGWDALLVGAFAAFVLGGLAGAVLVALRRGTAKSHIPFGPWMLLGAWVGLCAGDPVLDWYLGAMLT